MNPLCRGTKILRAITSSLLFLMLLQARAELPAGVRSKLLAGYDMLGSASGELNSGALHYYVVILGVHGEKAEFSKTQSSHPRPLLVFLSQPDGSFALVGRNDSVVKSLDAAGMSGDGCDPVTDGMGDYIIAVKGAYFTVQNSVGCGSHWTDYITFHYDAARREFLFSSEIHESWKPNDSQEPRAAALVLDHRRVLKAEPGKPIPFQSYTPR